MGLFQKSGQENFKLKQLNTLSKAKDGSYLLFYYDVFSSFTTKSGVTLVRAACDLKHFWWFLLLTIQPHVKVTCRTAILQPLTGTHTLHLRSAYFDHLFRNFP